MAYGEVINIGGVEEVTILNLAKKIIKLSGSKSQISFLDYDKVYNSGFEDMARRVPNTEKLMKITKFTPSLKLEEILIDIIKMKEVIVNMSFFKKFYSRLVNQMDHTNLHVAL